MKKLFVLLFGAGALLAFAAEDAAKKTPAPAATPAKPTTSDAVTLAASAAKITAPLVLKDGVLSQPEQTELSGGGKAIFEFTLAKAGAYVIQAVVDAPGEDTNSFFLNIDADPEDPKMIWDIDVTSNFEERTVSWRGNGDANSDEFIPKRFTLTAGAHKLIIVGREPAKLKSLTIRLTAPAN